MIDSFIEGDIKLDDILARMNEEKKHSRQHNLAVRDNRRISEMFSKNLNKSGFTH